MRIFASAVENSDVPCVYVQKCLKSKLLKMNVKVLNYCRNRRKCTKYETCEILHRAHILYSCSDFIFCTFAQVSYFVHLHRFHILYICTGFKFCTFAQVSNFVHLHRFQILYICTGFIFCTFAQFSHFVLFEWLYSFKNTCCKGLH